MKKEIYIHEVNYWSEFIDLQTMHIIMIYIYILTGCPPKNWDLCSELILGGKTASNQKVEENGPQLNETRGSSWQGGHGNCDDAQALAVVGGGRQEEGG